MYELIADIGNSFVKLALFKEGEVFRFSRIDSVSEEVISTFLDGIVPERIGIASVSKPAEDYLSFLAPFGEPVCISARSKLPIGTSYLSRETLGVDRIANAVAAHRLAGGHPALAIDTGTCLTYDMVTANGQHLGGAISPGIRLRALTMHEHSARLPYVIPDSEPELIGRDTESSIASGIFNGIIAEIDGIVARYRTDHPHLYVVITGGDALSFQRVAKSAIFADPLLTLKGIHEILLHQ